jgi:hypothetical protein
MGTGAEVALIALTAASTAYSASQAGAKPQKPAELPKAAQEPTIDLAVQNRMAQEQAQSAGGTILSKTQGEGAGNSPANPGNQPRKSLLGS